MYRTDFWTLWEKARVGCSERTASKHVYYLGWNRSPAQVGCMSQVLRPGALGRPRGIRWRGRWEGGLGWGIHVYPRLIHVNKKKNERMAFAATWGKKRTCKFRFTESLLSKNTSKQITRYKECNFLKMMKKNLKTVNCDLKSVDHSFTSQYFF